MCGTGAALRLLCGNDLQVIGIDTHGSVLFGQPDRPGRLLRGLGNSLMPRNVTHSIFDEVHWVSPSEAFKATHVLCQEHGLYMGPTSGAAWLVAEWWARQNPQARVVAILPDEGHRYQSTVYDTDWLREKGLSRAALPSSPVTVDDPRFSETVWARYPWRRRTYQELRETLKQTEFE